MGAPGVNWSGGRSAHGVRRRSLAAATLALLASSLVVPLGAGASAPVASGPLEVQVWPEEVPGGAVIIIATELEESVKLPATVRLPLPEGLNVDWAGEISPSDPASDVARTYTVRDATDGRYVEFEVSEFREAQIDLSSLALDTSGDTLKATLRFVQSTPASETGFSVRIPAGAELKRSEPKAEGRPSTNAAGESLYALESQSLAVGDELDVAIEYRRKAPVTPASRADGLLIGLAIAAALAAAVLALVIARQRSSAAHRTET